MSAESTKPAERPIGRRESKKADTKRRLQAEALALFTKNGYEHTTVADIAAAADVSERTYFRYFASKRDVVLWDYFDEAVVDSLRRQPGDVSSVDAFRQALRDGFARMTEAEIADQYRRSEFMMAVPDLRIGLLDQLAASTVDLARLLAQRLDRPAADPAVTALTGAIVGVVMSVQIATGDDTVKDIPAALDAALARLNQGFGDL